MFKLGIDYHDVITNDPAFFSKLAKQHIQSMHEVHIISGNVLTDEIREFLREHDIPFTHWFSIEEYLTNREHFEIKDGNKWFESTIWNKEKSRYCQREEISLHYDDQYEYLIHFTTPYVHYQPKSS